jgi:23S rRNA pseudouridine1911/1915/1917 synthase
MVEGNKLVRLNMKKTEILYEDEDIAVVDKPSGLLVHPDGSNGGPFLTSWILKKWPDTKNVGEILTLRTGETIHRPGIIHRLDKETSGCLLIAKTQIGFEYLKKQFQERTVEKNYNTFAYGHIKNLSDGKEGVIDRPIGKSRKNFRAWSAQRGARGTLREALTEYTVLKEGYLEVQRPSDKESDRELVTFLEVRPKTGRTHQIRVHMKAINHPIVCDKLYAPKHPCLGFGRLALHASSIEFKDLKGEKVRVEAPFTNDFQKAIENIHTL